jgi:hypothetical protein
VKKLQASFGYLSDLRWNPGGEGMILAKHSLPMEQSNGAVMLTLHASDGEQKQV